MKTWSLSYREAAEKGFSLIEMLVSLIIFSFVMIALYTLFDQGRWYSLHAEKTSNAQDNGRLVMEQMERDMRMIGSGVPFGTSFTAGISWRPWIFEAGDEHINFRADIDNVNSQFTQAEAAGSIDINVLDETVFPATTKVVLQNRMRRWQGVSVSSVSSGVITVGTGLLQPYDLGEGEVFTPEHIFYRFTSAAAYPFGTIERSIRAGNDPVNDASTAGLTWETLATNILSLQFQYFALDGTSIPLSGSPLLVQGNNVALIHRIVPTVIVRERARKAQEWQDMTFTSEIFVRCTKP